MRSCRLERDLFLSRDKLQMPRDQVCGNAVEKFGSLSGSWYAGSPHRIQAIGWTSGLVEQEVSTCCFGDSVTDSESRLEIQAVFIRHLNARTSQALPGICANYVVSFQDPCRYSILAGPMRGTNGYWSVHFLLPRQSPTMACSQSAVSGHAINKHTRKNRSGRKPRTSLPTVD